MIERIYNIIALAFDPLTDIQIIVVILGFGAICKIFNKIAKKIYTYISRGD